MKDLKTTNILLLFIVIPLVFYLLKILSFIFIPLTFSMFIALFFLPLMRWLRRKKVANFISVIFIIIILISLLMLAGELIQLIINEVLATQESLMGKAETKIVNLVVIIESFFGMERLQGENVLSHYLADDSLVKNFGSTIMFLRSTVTMTLMTVFFVVLLLSESFNFEKLLNSTVFKSRHTSVKTFIKIEKDIFKFVIVKFLISLLTGVGFGLACFFFNVSFPLFWGLFAFLINFVQMVGSVISVVLLSLFAFVELDPTGILLFFIIIITGVQVLMGGILEPIFMGKTFSLNVVTVLVMLMLWGYLWGVPGLIMAIPITVFIKILLVQNPKTKTIANLMSGKNTSLYFQAK